MRDNRMCPKPKNEDEEIQEQSKPNAKFTAGFGGETFQSSDTSKKFPADKKEHNSHWQARAKTGETKANPGFDSLANNLKLDPTKKANFKVEFDIPVKVNPMHFTGSIADDPGSFASEKIWEAAITGNVSVLRGEWFQIGTVKFGLDSSQGVYLSADTKMFEKKIAIDQPILTWADNHAGDIGKNAIEALIQNCKDYGFAVENISLREIEFAGPKLKAGLGYGENISVNAGAQLAEIVFRLDIPSLDEIVTLECGLALGAKVKFSHAQTKKGKSGIEQEKSISAGAWSINISYRAKQAEQQDEHHFEDTNELNKNNFFKNTGEQTMKTNNQSQSNTMTVEEFLKTYGIEQQQVTQDIKDKMDEILKRFNDQQKQQQKKDEAEAFAAKVHASNRLFSDIQLLTEKCPALARVASLGHATVKMGEAFNTIQKTQPAVAQFFASTNLSGMFDGALSTFAMLQPYVAIASSAWQMGMALFGRKKKDNSSEALKSALEQIMKNLERVCEILCECIENKGNEIIRKMYEFCNKTRYVLQAVIEIYHQTEIKNIDHGIQVLSEDSRFDRDLLGHLIGDTRLDTLVKQLNTLGYHLDGMREKQFSWAENKSEFIHAQEKLKDMWLSKNLVSAAFNGSIYSSDSTRQDMRFVGNGIERLEESLGFLMPYAVNNLGVESNLIRDMGYKFPNVNLWIRTLNTLIAASLYGAKYYQLPLYDNHFIESNLLLAENTAKAIDELIVKQEDIFTKIFKNYESAVDVCTKNLEQKIIEALSIYSKDISLKDCLVKGLIDLDEIKLRKQNGEIVKAKLNEAMLTSLLRYLEKRDVHIPIEFLLTAQLGICSFELNYEIISRGTAGVSGIWRQGKKHKHTYYVETWPASVEAKGKLVCVLNQDNKDMIDILFVDRKLSSSRTTHAGNGHHIGGIQAYFQNVIAQNENNQQDEVILARTEVNDINLQNSINRDVETLRKLIAKKIIEINSFNENLADKKNNLLEKLQTLSYQSVPGDGHCLYHAVSLYTHNGDQAFLRKIVAAHLEANLGKLVDYIHLPANKTLEQYVEDIRNGKEWADNIDIEVLMRVLDRPIIIVDTEGNIRNRDDLERFKGKPIFVAYNGFNHYDALLRKEDFTVDQIIDELQESRNSKVKKPTNILSEYIEACYKKAKNLLLADTHTKDLFLNNMKVMRAMALAYAQLMGMPKSVLNLIQQTLETNVSTILEVPDYFATVGTKLKDAIKNILNFDVQSFVSEVRSKMTGVIESINQYRNIINLHKGYEEQLAIWQHDYATLSKLKKIFSLQQIINRANPEYFNNDQIEVLLKLTDKLHAGLENSFQELLSIANYLHFIGLPIQSPEKLSLNTEDNNNELRSEIRRGRAQTIQKLKTQTLIEIVKNNENPYADIKLLAENLDPESIKGVVDKKDGDGKTPLHYAVQLNDLELIKLLISLDADLTLMDKENKKAVDYIPKNALASQALLSLREKFQQDSQELGFSINKALGFIEEADRHIATQPYLEEPVIFLFGKTGAGKSTLINFINGTDYMTDPASRRNNRLIPITDSTTVGEIAKTGGTSTSTTKYPEVYKTKLGTYVDMAGFKDTNGDERDICTGISTQLIAAHCSSVKAIVFVCNEADVFDPKKDKIRESLDKLGLLLEKDPVELSKYFYIAITGVSGKETLDNPELVKKHESDVYDELKEWYDNEVNKQNNGIKIALEHLLKANVILAQADNPESRSSLVKKITENKISQPVRNFNFANYHSHAEKFKYLLGKVNNYRINLYKNVFEKISALCSFWKMQIVTDPTIGIINFSSFSDQFNFGATLLNLQNQTKKYHDEMSEIINALNIQLSKYIDTQYSFVGNDTKVVKAIIEEILQEKENIDLFARLDNISNLLELNNCQTEINTSTKNTAFNTTERSNHKQYYADNRNTLFSTSSSTSDSNSLFFGKLNDDNAFAELQATNSFFVHKPC